MARVLVVDDEPQILNSLRRLMSRSGFEVETAGSGEEGLSKLDGFAPDVVVSDFRMPKMNGAEFLAGVKNRHPRALRIILSGCADFDSVYSSINQAEISQFLTKPWDDEALIAKVRSLLAEHDRAKSAQRSA